MFNLNGSTTGVGKMIVSVRRLRGLSRSARTQKTSSPPMEGYYEAVLSSAAVFDGDLGNVARDGRGSVRSGGCVGPSSAAGCSSGALPAAPSLVWSVCG